MALVGNTIRLIATFKDFDGVVVDAANITITVTDMTGVVDELTMNSDNRQIDGTYAISYTIPHGLGPLKIQISGDVDGLPEVNYIKVDREN